MNDNNELLYRVRKGDKKAVELLITNNMGLVYSIAKRFIGRGQDFEDLSQIGVIGLMKAIEKFDMSFGVVFSTYAVPMISGEIKRFLRDDGIIKVSRNLRETAMKIKTVTEILRQKSGCEPTIGEISNYIGISVEEITMAMEAVGSCSSINELVGEDGQGEKQDFIAVTENEEEIIDKLSIKESLQALNEQARQIIVLRYFKGKTQTEISKLLGISQVQVSRIEKKSLLKMRESFCAPTG